MQRAITIGMLLALVSCTPATQHQVTTTVSTVCNDLAALPATATATLNSQDPHSALGVLWADAKSACTNGVPTAGVSQSWGQLVWAETKALIPQVLPALIPVLVGLL